MSHIILALRDEEFPPVVFWVDEHPGPVTPESCEEVSVYVAQAWQNSNLHCNLEPGRVINFIVLPADGFPFAIPTKFLIHSKVPIIPPACPDVEEEQPRSIGFTRPAAA
jgi:hypothetical protein